MGVVCKFTSRRARCWFLILKGDLAIHFCKYTSHNHWYIFKKSFDLNHTCDVSKYTVLAWKRLESHLQYVVIVSIETNILIMDNFVAKMLSASSQEKKRLHFLPVNISVKYRARKYAEETFYVGDGLLYCSLCNI